MAKVKFQCPYCDTDDNVIYLDMSESMAHHFAYCDSCGEQSVITVTWTPIVSVQALVPDDQWRSLRDNK